jgi:glucan 1,3-beta-glucosidase
MKKWYGVNLGNWLLIETWMKPSLTEGTQARDEYTLAEAKGADARAFFDRHRDNFITETDFQFLAEWGINAVRIPYGYWIVEPDGPFVGGIEYLDRALTWCAKYKIDGILDLHGAPGFQGTAHHTGRANAFEWDKKPEHRQRTLGIIEAVSQRYANHPGLAGVSLLNEPENDIPAPMLLEYYQAGYEIVRKYNSEQVAVIAEAHQNPRLAQFHGKLKGTNIVTDTHYYQCFWEEHFRLDLNEHIAFPLTRLVPRFHDFNHAGDMIVGEWSLSFGKKERWQGVDEVQRQLAIRAYADAQLFAYSCTRGWFFWSYRVEGSPVWSFRDSVRLGYLPPKLGPAGEPGPVGHWSSKA